MNHFCQFCEDLDEIYLEIKRTNRYFAIKIFGVDGSDIINFPRQLYKQFVYRGERVVASGSNPD